MFTKISVSDISLPFVGASIIFGCLLRLQVDLYAGAIFINQALKWNLYYSVLVLLFITAIYTIGGKLC